MDATVEQAQESRVEINHVSDSLTLLLYLGLLVLTLLTIWLFKRQRFRFLHETGLAVLYGLLVGVILRFGLSASKPSVSTFSVSNETSPRHPLPPERVLLNMTDGSVDYRIYEYDFKRRLYGNDIETPIIDEKATFNPEVFFNIILPPIIFCAGYNMKRKHFFSNIGSILTLAFVGTTISCLVVGSIVYGFSQLSARLRESVAFYECLLFGAFVSATDPVTVLAIFADLQVDADLYALVFGESVLNDAVAIVLAQSIEQYGSLAAGGGGFSASALLQAVLSFLSIFCVALGIGSLIGCSTALITKFTRVREQPELESSLVILMSYCTYLAAEAAGSSGIVAVLFCAICQAHYTYNNLSARSQSDTKAFFGLLNFLAENFTFVYIGVSVFTYSSHQWDGLFAVGGFLGIAAGRALNVYPLCLLLDAARRRPIGASRMHMLMFSGLRGAIAFALAIRNTNSGVRKIIFSTTLVIVMATVLLCGGLTTQMLQWLRIPVGVEEAASGTGEVESPSRAEVLDSRGLGRWWQALDSRFLKPLLTHARPLLTESCSTCCLPLAQLLTTEEQMSRAIASGRRRPADQEDVDVILDNELGPGGFSNPAGPQEQQEQQQQQQQQQQQEIRVTSGSAASGVHAAHPL